MKHDEYVLVAEPCPLNKTRQLLCTAGGVCNGCLANGTHLVWDSAIPVRRARLTTTSHPTPRTAWLQKVDQETPT